MLIKDKNLYLKNINIASECSYNFLYLQKLSILNSRLNVDIRAVRDDYFPMYLGGNKARKFLYIMNQISESGCNAIVTTGGAQSNHARVAALAAAEQNWPCILILHGEGEAKNPRGNEKLMRLSGAKIRFVNPSDIASEIEKSIRQLKKEGYNPFKVPGGGHCLIGALAFADAIECLKNVCDNIKWYPDYIVHPSGTGTTQAGLLGGIRKIGWRTHVIGISVARRNPYGKNVVQDAYSEIMQQLECVVSPDDVDFRDDWIMGGYEKSDKSIFRVIGSIAKLEGLILDPTYTGKAFKALLDLIECGDIPRKSKVIYWHTGGVINLLASNDPIKSYLL